MSCHAKPRALLSTTLFTTGYGASSTLGQRLTVPPQLLLALGRLLRLLHQQSEADLEARPQNDAELDATSLLDSAASFFCGLYPFETPHFWWGEGIHLPWASQYLQHDGSGSKWSTRIDISQQIADVARPLLEAGFADGQCPMYGVTYGLVPGEDQQHTMQSLAVEVMLSADAFLAKLPDDAAAALPWLSLGYKNLIECSQHAQQVLRWPDKQHGGSRWLH